MLIFSVSSVVLFTEEMYSPIFPKRFLIFPLILRYTGVQQDIVEALQHLCESRWGGDGPFFRQAVLHQLQGVHGYLSGGAVIICSNLPLSWRTRDFGCYRRCLFSAFEDLHSLIHHRFSMFVGLSFLKSLRWWFLRVLLRKQDTDTPTRAS